MPALVEVFRKGWLPSSRWRLIAELYPTTRNLILILDYVFDHAWEWYEPGYDYAFDVYIDW